ncbi:MAG: hypothetical protein M1829_003461 [Trizodia sp. TS-e1964]|nr:MAG: hypothetical protein M1829_003461 [Trizodia sp. TS-e1964]
MSNHPPENDVTLPAPSFQIKNPPTLTSSPPQDQGATPRELILEACRRNNTSLLHEVLAEQPDDAPALAHLLNSVRDPLGNHCLHVAASAGALEVLDLLLDQEGVEVDPVDRLRGDTPLHAAVRFVNGQTAGEREQAGEIVELLLDAGADPRLMNKARLKPGQLVDPANEALRAVLQKAEYAVLLGDDIVREEEGEGEGGGPGSASDSE